LIASHWARPAGGAIKISPHDEVHLGLLAGEGIETVLSASKELYFKPVWSLIDKGNLAKFPVLSGLECLTIAVDNDPGGDGQRAAMETVKRQTQGGLEVVTVKPTSAKDFNDVIRDRKHG
jgi:putative DNA primase/helicase